MSLKTQLFLATLVIHFLNIYKMIVVILFITHNRDIKRNNIDCCNWSRYHHVSY